MVDSIRSSMKYHDLSKMEENEILERYKELINQRETQLKYLHAQLDESREKSIEVNDQLHQESSFNKGLSDQLMVVESEINKCLTEKEILYIKFSGLMTENDKLKKELGLIKDDKKEDKKEDEKIIVNKTNSTNNVKSTNMRQYLEEEIENIKKSKKKEKKGKKLTSDKIKYEPFFK